jgi:hypothetical protein
MKRREFITLARAAAAWPLERAIRHTGFQLWRMKRQAESA